jgi:signal transduction protein with GAF and PtsI domain
MTNEDRVPLRDSVAAVRALFAAAACSCALVDEDGATLTFAAADGAGADQIVGVALPVSRGIAGWAVLSGQPISIRDVAADPRFARDVAESTEYVPQAVMAAPMFTADGEVLGVLEVLDPGIDQGSDWALAVLGTLAAQVGALVALGRTTTSARGSDLEQLGRQVLAAVSTYRSTEH